MAADSEETRGESFKLSVPKMHISPLKPKRGWFCIIGGAGHSDFIDILCERIESIPNAVQSHSGFRTTLEEILRDFYEGHIYKAPDYSALDIQLLIALWTKADGLALFQTARTATKECKNFACIGWGEQQALSVMKLWYKNNRPSADLILLATHVIKQAKEYVPGCGGDTWINVLNANRGGPAFAMHTPKSEKLLAAEEYSEMLDDMVPAAFYACGDWELDDEAFKKRLADLTRTLSWLRHQWQSKYRKTLGG